MCLSSTPDRVEHKVVTGQSGRPVACGAHGTRQASHTGQRSTSHRRLVVGANARIASEIVWGVNELFLRGGDEAPKVTSSEDGHLAPGARSGGPLGYRDVGASNEVSNAHLDEGGQRGSIDTTA